MIVDADHYFEHYGTPRHSGRYPWGSGGEESKRNQDFLGELARLRKEGLSDTEIAKGMGISRNELQAKNTIARNQQKQELINQVNRMADKGMSNSAIGRQLNLNESSIRAIRQEHTQKKLDVLQATADMLKKQVEEKEIVDVGRDVELDLPLTDGGRIPIARTKFDVALAMLREEGYEVHTLKIPQATTRDQKTTYKVLVKPGVTQREAWGMRDRIQQINAYTEDGGRSYKLPQKPLSISSKRIAVRYGDEGGSKLDGVIEVRPGVKDLGLGKSSYAQVRIAVDGTHYLKGMAIYRDDLPDGVDLRFNTNKSNTGNKKDAFKKMEDDPESPFKASVRQITDEKGKVKSAMNIVNEEGDWDKWKNSLPSQMLSKQSPDLAKAQLALTQERTRKELNDILALTNPAVKRRLLKAFSDETDAAAVHLKAANMPRQRSKVILPVTSMKETEVYAPSFRDGERVALVRFPHGGLFEIPQLTVNNRNPEAKRLLGTAAKDAIGINHKVAERLSGADFDGDHVLVIPNNKDLVKSKPSLEGLKDFDPRSSFPPFDGMKTIDGGHYNAKTGEVHVPKGKRLSPRLKNQEMGKVSNLITDMTIKGASNEELARAVRHSMVVIDSEKHHLDWKASERANGIHALKAKYQAKEQGPAGGASTLLSRSTAEVRIDRRKERPAAQGGPIDRATGEKKFVPTHETYVDKNGRTVVKKFKSTRGAETSDAHTLVSEPFGTPIERIYADHANHMKAMANEARKVMVSTKNTPRSESAKGVYANEVASLTAKLNIARKNAPRERQAQALANAQIRLRKQANPSMDPDDEKKLKNREIKIARARVNADKEQVKITPKEWEAIQAGAISNHTLTRILDNADLKTVRELATPRENKVMTSVMTARAKQMLASGYSQADVADQLGIAVSTLNSSISEQE